MSKLYLLFFALIILFHFSGNIQAQNYTLVWEDNFESNTLDPEKWNVDNHVGIWNTGANRELQHYRKENVSVGDDGNGNSCLILTAKHEEYNGYSFTSGKVTTKGKFAFRRGKLEASIKMPDLANGLWPAFWTLGYTPIGWPDCGEIDVLEMGHSAGLVQSAANSYIGAHLHWGPYPSNYGRSKVVPYNLSSGFFKHTLVWTENTIEVYFHEDTSPYFTMSITGTNTEEFRDFSHYIILNLAVGGAMPHIFSPEGITAPMPANMYIDWVKVYQLEEDEDFGTSDLPVFGRFGVFEENASVDMRMDLGFDLHEHASGLAVRNNETPKEGDRVLSYNIEAGSDFEIRLSAALNRNMVNYEKGSAQLYVKTEALDDIQIGVADSAGNEAFVTWGSNVDKNFLRDGQWQLVYVPLEEMAEQGVDLSALADMLVLKGNFEGEAYLSIDEVVYSETLPLGGIYGIYTNNPLISDKFVINNVSGHIHNWENTVVFNNDIPAYEGEEVLSFRSGSQGWWGLGLFSSSPLNFENFTDGYLNLALRTASMQEFTIAIHGANQTQGSVVFNVNEGKYGFERDGKWHKIAIPMSDFLTSGLDLSACGNIFTMSGLAIGNLGVDDIYLSENLVDLENPALCYAETLDITPKNTVIGKGSELAFAATATNQYGNAADAFVSWQSSGGSIDEYGVFTANEPGVYTITATLGDLSSETTVTVEEPNAVRETLNSIEIAYFPREKCLSISNIAQKGRVVLTNVGGALVYDKEIVTDTHEIDMSKWPQSVYIIRVVSDNESLEQKIVNQ